MKVINRDSPEGNVFYIIGYIQTHVIDDPVKGSEFLDKVLDLANYEDIVKYVNETYKDHILII